MALSIRQPWAWLVVNAGKDYENRAWNKAYACAQMALCPPGSNFLVHASKSVGKREYEEAVTFARQAGYLGHIPHMEDFKQGGVIGMVRHHGLFRASKSRWFTGPMGLKLSAPYPLPFRAMRGQLGFFQPDELR